MDFRCIIKLRFKKIMIGKDYSGKYHIIKKNKHSRKFRTGQDYIFYCKKAKKYNLPYLIPISDEEAGVIFR